MLLLVWVLVFVSCGDGMGVGDLVFVLLLVFYICTEQPLLMMVLAWVLVLVFVLNSVGLVLVLVLYRFIKQL